MFRDVLIMAALAVVSVSCSGHACAEDSNGDSSPIRYLQYDVLRSYLRFSQGLFMLNDPNGIPYQYHVPKVDMMLEDWNNGRVGISTGEFFPSKRRRVYAPDEQEHAASNEPAGKKKPHPSGRYSWRLANTARKLTALELKKTDMWRRDPVPLNRLILSMESPVFLGKFFYALTSLTEIDGTVFLSRFYYAPVFTARYGNKKNRFKDFVVDDMELNVFSICLEPSDAPEDVHIPLMHRPQRIIDVGLRESRHNKVYDVRNKLKENATEKLNMAEKCLTNENWSALFVDPISMASRWLPGLNSPYETIKTSFGDYCSDHLVSWSLAQSVFHRYDFVNDAYIFAYGPGGRNNFNYSVDDARLLIFLDPRIHFRDETAIWNICVDLWREEMSARYGTFANSRLVHPRAYLNESASTEAYYEMMPRYEGVGTLYKRGPRRKVCHPGNSCQPKKPQHQSGVKKPRKQKAEDARGELEFPREYNGPETITGPGESADLMPPRNGYSPIDTAPAPNESLDTLFCNPGGWTTAYEPSCSNLEARTDGYYSEFGARRSNGPDIPGTSGLSSNDLYASGHWIRKLPSPAGFRTITDAQINETTLESTDSGQAFYCLSDAEPYSEEARPSGVFYDVGDNATGSHNGTLPTRSNYVSRPIELFHANPAPGSLQYETGYFW